jgi:protein-disulfide isomerase
MSRHRLAVLTLLCASLAGAPARGQDEQSIPSPDLPPKLTTSGKVHPSRDPARPPALGPEDARVRVILVSDFQCPVCARMTKATRQILEEWPGEVRLEFLTFASPLHRQAEGAAVAALAAQRQGKFWEMHDALFADQGALDPAGLRRAAASAGLDLQRWERDVADPKLRERVQRETADAARLGATGTPTYLVNGKPTVGWGSWHVFRRQVDEERNAVDALLAKGTKPRDVEAQRARANAKDDAAFAAYRDIVLKAAPPASAKRR